MSGGEQESRGAAHDEDDERRRTKLIPSRVDNPLRRLLFLLDFATFDLGSFFAFSRPSKEWQTGRPFDSSDGILTEKEDTGRNNETARLDRRPPFVDSSALWS